MYSSRITRTLVVSSLLAVCTVATGCATGGLLVTDHEPTTHARVTLSPMVPDETVLVAPAALNPTLTSADRVSRMIAAELGETATVDIHFCVSPAGGVVSAELTRSSSLPEFDQAVLTDILAWKFEVQPGPTDVRNCQTSTIVYRTRS